jgi:DNA-binding response OmpR family regulator
MKTVLVIDDDAAIARGVQEVLAAENLKILVANTGQKGYNLAKQENVDLIILDLKLPDKSGEDICRDLRRRAKRRKSTRLSVLKSAPTTTSPSRSAPPFLWPVCGPCSGEKGRW